MKEILRFYRVNTPHDLIAAAKGENSRAAIAACTKVIGELEKQGSAAANLLLEQTADELTLLCTVAAQKVGREDLPVILSGGMACVSPILEPSLMLHAGGAKSSALERPPQLGSTVVAQHGVGEKDVLFLVSNSGRNAVPIDAALEGKKRGAVTVAIPPWHILLPSPPAILRVNDCLRCAIMCWITAASTAMPAFSWKV